jgi:hypothetical protein
MIVETKNDYVVEKFQLVIVSSFVLLSDLQTSNQLNFFGPVKVDNYLQKS